jgi:hypothetical protein
MVKRGQDRIDERRRRRLRRKLQAEIDAALDNSAGFDRILDISDEEWEEAQREDELDEQAGAEGES